jgi:predicted neutral ceramidase superfamily lipid hydrolase
MHSIRERLVKKAYALDLDTPSKNIEEELHSRQERLEKLLPSLLSTAVSKIDQMAHRLSRFHFIAINCLSLQLLLLLGTLLLLPYSSMLAVELALLFLTSFSYLSLRSYLSAKVPDEIHQLYSHYSSTCRSAITYVEGDPNSHILMNYALSEYASYIHERHYLYFPWISKISTSFLSLAQKLSCLLHWELIHQIQETLLEGAVQECIKLVKLAPTQIPPPC